MLQNNTRKINKMMAVTLAFCSLSMIALLVLNFLHIYQFEKNIILIISIIGFCTTLSPIILFKCKVSDEFLKYYMLFWMSILIGALGCFNGIGIYITFVLVPVASCLYFDRRFTMICSAFSYAMMCVAVYINTAGKMEITYWGWSHLETFEAYILGFTIEYIVVFLFLNQILKHANEIMATQHESLLRLQAQDYRYELLMKGTDDIIFEFLFDEKKYSANRSMYAKKGETNVPLVIHDHYELITKYPHLNKMLEYLIENKDKEEFESFEMDFSYLKDETMIPLWFSCECFIVKDQNKPVSIIGKMRDITQAKLSQERLQRQRVSDMYRDTMSKKKKNSTYDFIMDGNPVFTEEDFAYLTEGNQFLAKIMDTLQYDSDPDETMQDILEKICDFFHLDRIGIMESDISGGTQTLIYQWNSNPENAMDNVIQHFEREEIAIRLSLYDKFGYIEINPEYKIFTCGDAFWNYKNQNAIDAMLGTQLWLPTLSDGKYNGAVFFDKYDTTPYTTVEKLLLAEVVNTLAAYVKKISAESANKAKSVFLSTMSHEIRTPMNAIVGMTEVALREDMSDDVRKCLKTVQSSSFGLLALINDILDFSKIEAGKIEIITEKYHILSMVNDVYEIIKARNNNKLAINLNISDNFPSILKGDIVRLKQVIINFCTNSIKYTDKGSVSLYFDYEKKEDDTCLFHFSVKDTGIGIKEDDLNKLFKSYVQVDTRVNHHKEGTGLGLAISKQLIDLMDGSVSVESEYGKGSVFSFTVPQEVLDWTPAGKLEDFQYEDFEEKENNSNSFTAPEAKVLIVDDTEINLMVAKALLAPLNMQIETAGDGYEALKKIEENSYDLIFMDHFMPGLDGVQVTKKIRSMENNPNATIPIIALTADAMSGVKEELLKEGMDDFLSKPIVLQQAHQLLHRWLPKEKILFV